MPSLGEGAFDVHGVPFNHLPTRATLFVGDLSYFCSESHLRNLFGNFGRVINVEIKRGKFGDSLMHGFVDLEDASQAKVAVQQLHNSLFMGRIMR